MSGTRPLTLSIVSHNQGELVRQLLNDLSKLQVKEADVILTLNVPEVLPFEPEDFDLPLRIIHNEKLRGFGANHNAAFRECKTEFFCVLNPDLRFSTAPFSELIQASRLPRVGVVAPMVVNESGEPQDNARKFPTFWSLAAKLIKRTGSLDYTMTDMPLYPDWVAGMFMLFRSEVFFKVSGFDERYFMYYEDVDLCWRLRRRGYDIRLNPKVSVVHAARRESHKKVQYMRWHAVSMARFLISRFLRT